MYADRVLKISRLLTGCLLHIQECHQFMDKKMVDTHRLADIGQSSTLMLCFLACHVTAANTLLVIRRES